MILAALDNYYKRLASDPESGISTPGYSVEKISYAIVLDKDGEVVSVDDIRDTSGTRLVPKSIAVPQKPEGGPNTITPKFLWDKTSYALGVSLASNRSEREHEAFRQFHGKVLSESSDEGLCALVKFLGKWDAVRFSRMEQFAAHGEEFFDKNVVFRLVGDRAWLHERPEAQRIRASLLHDGEGEVGVCMVSGHSARLTRLHPPIKNVNGGHTAGGYIVSYNDDSYLSYRGSAEKFLGKNKDNNSSASAPVSRDVAFAYTTALNHLLRRDAHNRQRLQLGDSTVVFWAEATGQSAAAAEDLFAEFLDPKGVEAQATGRLADALELVRQGRPLKELDQHLDDDSRIYVLGLAPNAARISIRFWETGSLRKFAERLADHYNDLDIQPAPWDKPPAIWRLLLATAPHRDGKAKSEDIPPQLAGEMARAILSGRPYPYSLLATAIMRLRSDHDERAFGFRAALIKAVLVRAKRSGKKVNHEGGIPVSLDTSNTDAGYLLGRMFAQLESIQRAALEKINATIRDRYYGAASATPASVFPVLVRGAQHHLARLRKDRPGLAFSLERELSAIFNLLGTSFPRSLAMESQGHFAIGYYHQAQARYAGKDAHDINDESI